MTSTSIQLGFSSIGLPGATLETIFEIALKHQCDFLELRVFGKESEPEQHSPQIPVRVLGSSLHLTNPTEESLHTFADIVRIAAHYQAPHIRVFGGGSYTADPVPTDTLQTAANTVRRCRDIIAEQEHRCEILLETHDVFSASEDCLRLNSLLPEPVSILWDSHHTWRLAGESPSESWTRLSPLIRHVHFKDSVLDPVHKLGFRYVHPGRGEFPAAALLAVLDEAGYQGGLSLEWEKMWHPDLPPFEEALERFLALARRD